MEYNWSSPFTLNRKLGSIQRNDPHQMNVEINDLCRNLDSSIAQLEFQFHNLKELSNQLTSPLNNQNNVNCFTRKVKKFSLSPVPLRSNIRNSPIRYYKKQYLPHYIQSNINEDISLNTFAQKVSNLEKTLNHKDNIINQYTTYIQNALAIYDELTEENIKLKQQLKIMNDNQLNSYQREENEMEYNNDDNNQNMYIYQNEDDYRNSGNIDEYQQMEMIYKRGTNDNNKKDSLNIMNDNITALIKESKEKEMQNEIQIKELKQKIIDLEKEINNTNDDNSNQFTMNNNSNSKDHIGRLCSNISEPIN